MLRLTLKINTETIGDYEVRNVGPCRCGWNEYGDCGAYRYEVSKVVEDRTEPPMFDISHFREDGAETLAQLVLEQLSVSKDDPRNEEIAREEGQR